MADAKVTVRMRFHGAAKLAAQIKAVGEAARRATLAIVATEWPPDGRYERRVAAARRRSLASRPPRTRHGRQHRTRTAER